MKISVRDVLIQGTRYIRTAALAGGLCLGPSLSYAESLWLKNSNNERGMFADHRAGAVGDILTIVIDESSTSSSSQNSTTTKDMSIDNSVTQWLFPLAASAFGSVNGALPGTQIDGSNSFNGGGSISDSKAVTARASVLVIDRLPNGNLVVEGARKVSFAGESQWVVLRGVVRKSDITAANTVLSSRVADATVEFISAGAITDAQRKGWLSKLNDLVNPF
ncbi:MAG: flagellar basal body L-ring protein FlgH [Opitutales bacterium]|nr:flagellar basal body L-ring protein FlgH [Opitutales bacterium]NRA28172.1 flagellar basal body L-ring protein FlgH [Opitutales bacterium]